MINTTWFTIYKWIRSDAKWKQIRKRLTILFLYIYLSVLISTSKHHNWRFSSVECADASVILPGIKYVGVAEIPSLIQCKIPKIIPISRPILVNKNVVPRYSFYCIVRNNIELSQTRTHFSKFDIFSELQAFLCNYFCYVLARNTAVDSWSDSV